MSFNSDSGELARRMNTEAAKGVKYGGLSEEDALKLVTLNPATQLGIDQWEGSLEIGKDADFVIWSDHPLSPTAICEQTWIDGIKYFSLEQNKQLQKRDREFFLKETLNERKKFNLPPFGSLVALIFSGSNQITISNFIKNVINNLPKDKNIIVLGPIEAPIFLLRGKYRFRLLLKGQNKRDLNNYVRKLLTKSIQNNQVMITVDVDPYSFM